VFSSIAQVAAQLLASNSSTLAAVDGLLEAAQQGGPINVITWSGGAAAFTSAVNFLNQNGYSNITSLIGAITYVAPGNAGFLYSNQNTIILNGNGFVNGAATLTTLFGNIPVYNAPNCLHDFACIANYFNTTISDRQTSSCSSPQKVLQEQVHSSFRYLLPGADGSDDGSDDGEDDGDDGDDGDDDDGFPSLSFGYN
jgi:hypothetical protein